MKAHPYKFAAGRFELECFSDAEKYRLKVDAHQHDFDEVELADLVRLLAAAGIYEGATD